MRLPLLHTNNKPPAPQPTSPSPSNQAYRCAPMPLGQYRPCSHAIKRTCHLSPHSLCALAVLLTLATLPKLVGATSTVKEEAAEAGLNITCSLSAPEGYTMPQWPVLQCRKKCHIEVASPQQIHLLESLVVATALMIILSWLGVACAHGDQLLEVEYSFGELVSSIMTGCGLLNIVSININHMPGRLHTVDHLISLHDWHIVLI